MKKLTSQAVASIIGGGQTCGRWVKNTSSSQSGSENRYCSPADKYGNYTGGKGWTEYR